MKTEYQGITSAVTNDGKAIELEIACDGVEEYAIIRLEGKEVWSTEILDQKDRDNATAEFERLVLD